MEGVLSKVVICFFYKEQKSNRKLSNKECQDYQNLGWHHSRIIPSGIFCRIVADQKYFMVNQIKKKRLKSSPIKTYKLHATVRKIPEPRKMVSSLVCGNTNSNKYTKSRIMDNHLVPFDICHTKIGYWDNLFHIKSQIIMIHSECFCDYSILCNLHCYYTLTLSCLP